MKQKLAAFTIALTIGAPASLLAEELSIPGSVKLLSPHIHAVVYGGYWSSANVEGYYRAVVTTAGAEHVSQRLFLQWVRVNLEDGTYKVTATVPVKEINEGDAQGSLIEMKPDKSSKLGKFRMSVKVTKVRSEEVAHFTLASDGRPGEYTITPQTK